MNFIKNTNNNKGKISVLLVISFLIGAFLVGLCINSHFSYHKTASPIETAGLFLGMAILFISGLGFLSLDDLTNKD